jgi:hypothetical protein
MKRKQPRKTAKKAPTKKAATATANSGFQLSGC